MSQRHIKEPPQALPVAWWRLALGLAVIAGVVLAVVYAFAGRVASIPANDQTAMGKILELRKVVDGTDDSMYGGRILYGFEAHVQYSADGQLQDRWLRVSDGRSRDTLALKVAARPSTCLVYWPPMVPENAKCWLK